MIVLIFLFLIGCILLIWNFVVTVKCKECKWVGHWLGLSERDMAIGRVKCPKCNGKLESIYHRGMSKQEYDKWLDEMCLKETGMHLMAMLSKDDRNELSWDIVNSKGYKKVMKEVGKIWWN